MQLRRVKRGQNFAIYDDFVRVGQIRRIFSAFQENDSVGPELAEFLKAAVKYVLCNLKL